MAAANNNDKTDAWKNVHLRPQITRMGLWKEICANTVYPEKKNDLDICG